MLGYEDLEKRTGVFSEYTEAHGWTHHDAMPNWYDVCPNCTNPHWAWFKKGEHIKAKQVEFVAEEDGKFCLRCEEKWTGIHKDPYIKSEFTTKGDKDEN